MSHKKYDNEDSQYQGFGSRHGLMDRIGDSFSSVFSRKSRKKDKADDLLVEFSRKNNDDYELFVDEHQEQIDREKYDRVLRKEEKKQRAKKPATPFARKVKNIMTYSIIAAVIIITCIILSLTVLFKTQSFEVSGNTKYAKEDIIATSGIALGDNIFLANKTSASEKLIATYAYIEEANVSFAIPDTITIQIKEAVPSYIVKSTDTLYLVASSKGRILEQTDNPDKYDLPLFIGNDLKSSTVGGYIEYANPTTLKVINEIVTVFNDNGYKGITEIDATDTANITFTYDDRIKVKLGLPEDISYKVRTAMTIINEKLDINGAKTTEGELDVSGCNTTKKSYFKDKSLIDIPVPTTPPQEEPDYVDNDYDGYDDITGEWIEPTEEETKPPVSQDEWYLD